MVDERWVHEDALNAMAELVYFQFAALSNVSPPKFLFLATAFFAQASYLFSEGVRAYSPNLRALRERVISTEVDAIGFLILDDGHFSAAWIDQNGVYFADSLSHAPPTHLSDVLRWVFRDTRFHISNKINIVDVALQTALSGNGSCGIAAHNFIHRHAFGSVAAWHPSRSQQFRDAALLELAIFHLCASDRDDVSSL